MNAMFFLEVCPFVFNTGAVIFAAGSVSPVKLLSSIAKSIAYNKHKHVQPVHVLHQYVTTCCMHTGE